MKAPQLFSIAVTFFSSWCIFDSRALCGDTGISQDPNDVRFFMYNRSNYEWDAGILLDVNDKATFICESFAQDAIWKIIIHGFIHHYNCSVPQDLKDRYFETTSEEVKMFVIAVDWGPLVTAPNDPTSIISYPCAVENVEIAGKRVADLIVLLYELCQISPSVIHIIGFSLGAHVAGWAGEEVKKRCDQKCIGRITGLDPAGPMFYSNQPNPTPNLMGRPLQKEDAHFVDAIHTCLGGLGTVETSGDKDFYLNFWGLHPQPGCEHLDIGCSHDCAPNYFLQTIGRFLQPICACSFKQLMNQLDASCPCNPDGSNVFGENAKPSSESSYHLKMEQAPLSGKYLC